MYARLNAARLPRHLDKAVEWPAPAALEMAKAARRLLNAEADDRASVCDVLPWLEAIAKAGSVGEG